MTHAAYTQHPLARIRRTLPWGTWLDGATIADSEWIADGLTVESEAVDNGAGTTSAILSGVTEGESGTATCRVTDSNGRTKDFTVTLTGAVTPLETVNKDPDDSGKVVSVNYGFFDPGAVITASDWTVPSGITAALDDYDGLLARVELSGGTAGQTYRLTNVADLDTGERVAGVVDVFIKEQ